MKGAKTSDNYLRAQSLAPKSTAIGSQYETPA